MNKPQSLSRQLLDVAFYAAVCILVMFTPVALLRNMPHYEHVPANWMVQQPRVLLITQTVGPAPVMDGGVEMAHPWVCDPMAFPYFPCCDLELAPTRPAPPPSKEFKNDQLYSLYCARTYSSNPSEGSAWICGHREKDCVKSERGHQPGGCKSCVVYTGGVGKRATWTVRKIGLMDGPWSPDGLHAIFPFNEGPFARDGIHPTDPSSERLR